MSSMEWWHRKYNLFSLYQSGIEGCDYSRLDLYGILNVSICTRRCNGSSATSNFVILDDISRCNFGIPQDVIPCGPLSWCSVALLAEVMLVTGYGDRLKKIN